MSDLERVISEQLKRAATEPPLELDPAAIVRTQRSSAGKKRHGRSNSGWILASSGVIAIAMIGCLVALASYINAGHTSVSVGGGTVVRANRAPSALIAHTWRLEQIDDLKTSGVAAPTAPTAFDFTRNAASDNRNNSVPMTVTTGTIIINGPWANSLSTNAGPQLSPDQARFVYQLLQGRVSFTIVASTLTLSRGPIGSLTLRPVG